MSLVDANLVKYALSDIYCRQDGFYASFASVGLYENQNDAFISSLVKNVARVHKDECKDLSPSELKDMVSREYDDYLSRLFSVKDSGQADSLYQQAIAINDGVLKQDLASLKNDGDPTDEEIISECLRLVHSNPRDYWDACTNVLDMDRSNTSFPLFRKLVESIPYSKPFPSQEIFDDFMMSVRKEPFIDHVLLHKDSCDLVLDYHSGFYFISIMDNMESPVFEGQFHNDAESVYLDEFRNACPEETLSGCWSDSLRSCGLDPDSSSKHLISSEPFEVSLDGLHKAYERFEENHHNYGICGDWEIERVIIPDRSTPDRTQWVASFQQQAVAKCCMVVLPTHVSGYEDLKRIGNLSDKSFSDFCDIVTSFEPHKYRMAPAEQKRILKNSLSQGR